MWDLFGSFERAALIELGEAQNLDANIELFEISPEKFDVDSILESALLVIAFLPRRLKPIATVLIAAVMLIQKIGVQISEIEIPIPEDTAAGFNKAPVILEVDLADQELNSVNEFVNSVNAIDVDDFILSVQRVGLHLDRARALLSG